MVRQSDLSPPRIAASRYQCTNLINKRSSIEDLCSLVLSRLSQLIVAGSPALHVFVLTCGLHAEMSLSGILSKERNIRLLLI